MALNFPPSFISTSLTAMTMPEPKALPRSPPSPSYIPVITPRPSESALPSSLSVPQLGLVPPNRQPSGPGSLTNPTSSSTTATNATGIYSLNSGLPSFRSLRNFLPFVSGKRVSDASATGGTKGSFSAFGSTRRSITADRKSSSSYRRSEQSDIPVIEIEASRHRNHGLNDGATAEKIQVAAASFGSKPSFYEKESGTRVPYCHFLACFIFTYIVRSSGYYIHPRSSTEHGAFDNHRIRLVWLGQASSCY